MRTPEYILHAYNRPQLFAVSLLTLRDQIISKNRKITLVLDGAKRKEDEKFIMFSKAIFEVFFEGYSNTDIIQHNENKGIEVRCIESFKKAFDEKNLSCVGILEDDLFYERSYIHNVENLLNFVDNNDSVWSLSGFTRQTLYESDESLERNKCRLSCQHNLIGSIYKNECWQYLKPIFDDFLELHDKHPNPYVTKHINEKYHLNIPFATWDKIVDHLFQKHKKIRASTYNRYLYHMGIIGGSYVKETESYEEIKSKLKNVIKHGWNKLTMNSDYLNKFELNMEDPVFVKYNEPHE